jgi:hypothetical protein
MSTRGNTLLGDVGVGAIPHAARNSVAGEGEVMLETPRWLVVLLLGTALVALIVLVLYFLA